MAQTAFSDRLLSALLLGMVGLLLAGTNRCQESYCFGCNSVVDDDNRTPTATPTPDDDDDDLEPTGTPTPRPATATPTAAPTPSNGTPTVTPTAAISIASRLTPSAFEDALADLERETLRAASSSDRRGAANLNWLGEAFVKGNVVDSDGDGFSDDFEREQRSDPNDPESIPELVTTTNLVQRLARQYELPLGDGELAKVFEALLADTSESGCPDRLERLVREVLSSREDFNPEQLSQDSDGDCLPDAFERLIGSDPFSSDTDGDSVSDGLEVLLGSNPRDYDSDSDGIADWKELSLGSDPITHEGKS